MASVVVAVNGKACLFGECIESLLLSPQKKSSDPVRIQVALGAKYLNLSLDSNSNIAFEHAPYCPAFEHASPRHDGHIRVGVATIVERKGYILLTRRHSKLRSFPDVWVVPGGHIEPNETLSETAKRELFEETGLQKDIYCFDELLGVWESCFPHRASLGKMTHHHAVCYVHAVSSADEVLHLQASEVQSIAWINREQVLAILDADENMKISVFPAESASFTHPDVKGIDAWHGERALVSQTPEVYNAKWFLGNMTAGTHFALRRWLEKTTKSTL